MRSVTESGLERYPEVVLTDREWQAISETLHLCARQLQIVQLVLDGRKEAEIAEALSLSTHTVHDYLMRLHGKLNVHDRCGVIVRVFAAYISLQQRKGEHEPG